MKLLAPIFILPFAKAAIDGESALTCTAVSLPDLETLHANPTGVDLDTGIRCLDAWPQNDLSNGGLRVRFTYPQVVNAGSDYRDSFCRLTWIVNDADGNNLDATFWSTSGWSVGSEIPFPSQPTLNLQYPIGGLFSDPREGGLSGGAIVEEVLINVDGTPDKFDAHFECFDIGTVTGGEFINSVGMISPFPSAHNQEKFTGSVNVNGTWSGMVLEFASPFPTDFTMHDDVYVTATYDDSTGVAQITANGADVPYENVWFEGTCDGTCPMSCATGITVLANSKSYTTTVTNVGVQTHVET